MQEARCKRNEKNICDIIQNIKELEKDKYEMKEKIALIMQEQKHIKDTTERTEKGVKEINDFVSGKTVKEKEKIENKVDDSKKTVLGFLLGISGSVITGMIMYFFNK